MPTRWPPNRAACGVSAGRRHWSISQVWGGLADLTNTADDWSVLIRQVANPASGGDQIALRVNAVHVPRLVRRTGQPTPDHLQLRSGATYLVTGGLERHRSRNRRIPG